MSARRRPAEAKAPPPRKPQRLIVEYPGRTRRELSGAPLRELLALAVVTRPAG